MEAGSADAHPANSLHRRSLAAIDRNALGVCLRLGGLRQGHSQNAVLERRGDVVLLDLTAKREPPFEAT